MPWVYHLANNASQVWWTPMNGHQNSFDLKYCAAAPQTCLLCPISVLKLFSCEINPLLSYTVSKAYACHWQSETRKNERTMNHIYLKTTLRKGVCGKLRSRVSAKIHSNLVVHSGIEEINFIFEILTFLDIIVWFWIDFISIKGKVERQFNILFVALRNSQHSKIHIACFFWRMRNF